MPADSPIPVHHLPHTFRLACEEARRRGLRVGLVPTMGALHQGHLDLVRNARERCDFVAVSIFVNPTQFGPTEDLTNYPRTFEQDLEGCSRAGAACVFAPDASTMYPEGESTRVHVDDLAASLCGKSRPHHFPGVATIVTKLFAITGPCTAIFGRKDYQQLKIIERLTKDLLLPIQVIGHPTVREPDGLAMSSRNRYLAAEQRLRATAIPRGLRDAILAFQQGERRTDEIVALVRKQIEPAADKIDYIEAADADTLRPFGPDSFLLERAVLALAIRLGPARLIDNVVLGEDPPPIGSES